MSLYVDIGQGAGLGAATGVRPFLPPLLAGAMARGDALLDFEGSSWDFLESPGFLLALFALAVLWYGAERSRPNKDRRAPHNVAAAALGVVLGGLLFAGSLAAGDHEAWPGLVAGALCALLGFFSLAELFDRASRRLGEGANLIALYAEGSALVLAAIVIAVPPLAYLALAGMLLLLVKGRGDADRKYAGLRVLR